MSALSKTILANELSGTGARKMLVEELLPFAYERFGSLNLNSVKVSGLRNFWTSRMVCSHLLEAFSALVAPALNFSSTRLAWTTSGYVPKTEAGVVGRASGDGMMSVEYC